MGRKTVNVLSLCITIGFLLVSMEFGRGEYTSGIQRMTTDINRAIKQVLQQLEEIHYEEMEYTAKYDSSIKFHPKGMNILYNLTKVLNKGLFPEVIPDGLMFDDDGFHVKNDDYGTLANSFIPFLAFLGVLFLFAVFMPLCGFCFCCCRCCCDSGKVKPIEKHKDLCQKVIYATLMIGLGTLLLFGVVCAFVSNEHLQDGTEELTGNLRITISDTRKYFDETKKHIDILLNKNFKQLSVGVMTTLNNSNTILYDRLKDITNASSIDDALKMVNTMNTTVENLNELKTLTNTLRVEASQLNDAMRKIKRDLLEDLNNCNSIDECAKMQREYVDKLGTGIDFNSIPDISDDINTITNMLEEDGLIKAIIDGKDQLHALKDQIHTKVQDNIKTIKDKVNEAGNEIELQSRDVQKVIDETLNELVDSSNDGLKIADEYIVEYSKYRYYVGLGVSCVFLLITLFIALGLICGICGKKPTYGDDCCNKGAGSRFLMCGVCIMFLASFLLVAILLVHIAGMFVQILVCEPLRNPNDSRTMAFYDKNINLQKLIGINSTLKKITINCYNNKSAYEVFRLENKFNIKEVQDYVHKFDIDKNLEKLQSTITLDTERFELLSDPELEQMKRLGNDLGNIHDKFERIIDEIKVDEFTTVKLEELRKQLELVIMKLDGDSRFEKIVQNLKLSLLHLQTYIEKLFKPMVENANKTLKLAIETNEALKFGHKDFKTAIDVMAKKIAQAQEELKENGGDNIREVVKEFADKLTVVLQKYLDRIAYSLQSDVGKCGPLALVLNGTLTSTCDKIVLPMTGFAVSILWCIMLFIPTIVFSVTLADLYKKTDAYQGYVEAEYLYDAYADRENIPLARGKYAGKKKHKKKRYEGRGYLAESEPGREFPGGSQHHDARYSDMAPKHYEDFPNGGPPQYHRATEYERPPPYYCPGSTDH